MSANIHLVLLLAWLCSTATSGVHAQGFGGLDNASDGFALPKRDRVPVFPDDHGPHPDFRLEWWYVTANLTDGQGDSYGVQWTLFRTSVQPPAKARKGKINAWSTNQYWSAHAAITTADTHFFSEIRARGVHDLAGVQISPFRAWINDWQMRAPEEKAEKTDAIDVLSVSASGVDFSYQLELQAEGPLILHGEQGYSVKVESGQASHYYSQPHYAVQGTLNLPDGSVAVEGNAWLDREWSSQPLSAEQAGWDWVSLHFDDGGKLMGYRMRNVDGSDYTSATWIAADGTSKSYPNGSIKFVEMDRVTVARRAIPSVWRIELPDQAVEVEIRAINAQSWMATSPPYWEGPVTIAGSHTGRGYLEMTGYEEEQKK